MEKKVKKTYAKPRNPNGSPHWKKGVSGNPGGRPKTAIVAEKQKLINYAELIDLCTKCVKMKRDEIKEFLERPDVNMFELIYGGLVVQAAKGERVAREMLTDRLFGKVKQALTLDNLPETHIAHGQAQIIDAAINVSEQDVYVVEMNDNGKFERQRPRLVEAKSEAI
jgi:hypothetical protein